MIVTIRDRETLLSIDPEKAARYLSNRGWVMVDSKAGRYSLWAKPNNPAAEALLPANKSLVDFTLRIAEFLECLQQEEQRSQIEILEDIKALE